MQWVSGTVGWRRRLRPILLGLFVFGMMVASSLSTLDRVAADPGNANSGGQGGAGGSSGGGGSGGGQGQGSGGSSSSSTGKGGTSDAPSDGTEPGTDEGTGPGQGNGPSGGGGGQGQGGSGGSGGSTEAPGQRLKDVAPEVAAEIALTINYDLTHTLRVGRTGSAVDLEWVPTSGETLGYQVWRSDSPFALLATLPPDQTSYVDPEAPEGSKYKITYFTELEAAAGYASDPAAPAEVPGWNDVVYAAAVVPSPSLSALGWADQLALLEGAFILSAGIVLFRHPVSVAHGVQTTRANAQKAGSWVAAGTARGWQVLRQDVLHLWPKSTTNGVTSSAPPVTPRGGTILDRREGGLASKKAPKRKRSRPRVVRKTSPRARRR